MAWRKLDETEVRIHLTKTEPCFFLGKKKGSTESEYRGFNSLTRSNLQKELERRRVKGLKEFQSEMERIGRLQEERRSRPRRGGRKRGIPKKRLIKSGGQGKLLEILLLVSVVSKQRN